MMRQQDGRGICRRHIWAGLFCALGLIAGHGSAIADTPTDFKIAGIAVANPDAPPTSEQQTNGALGYSIHLGGFQRELAKVGLHYAGFVGLPRTAAALLALDSGQVDVAVTGDSPAVLSRARGDKHKLVYVGLPNGDDWVVARADGPRSLDDLAGKRVSSIFGSNMDYFFRNVLAAKGLTEKVTYTQLTAPPALPALQRNDIDAYVTASYIAALWQAKYGLKVIAKASTSYPQWQGAIVIAAREDFLAAHPGFPKALWAGLKTGIDAIRADPEAYFVWEAEVTGAPLAIVRRTIPTSYADQPIAPAGLKALQDVLDFQLASGAAKSHFAIADWIAKE